MLLKYGNCLNNEAGEEGEVIKKITVREAIDLFAKCPVQSLDYMRLKDLALGSTKTFFIRSLNTKVRIKRKTNGKLIW